MIFCVDDESAIRDIEVYTLQQTGFKAKGLSCADELFLELKNVIPDLIILDIMMAGKDGIQILKELKSNQKYANIPVIMATAKGSEMDKIYGLDLGSDDYLVKPFGMMEMVSHIKAVLRRTAPKTAKNILITGKLSVNLDEHSVLANGEKVMLTLKEFELLRIFMENPGRVFSRDILLEKIWGTEFYGETRTVDVHIGTLRTKLGECGEYIETIRGVGYRMEERH